MACELIDGGLDKDCNSNIGGLFTKMWIATFGDPDDITYTSPGNKIDAIANSTFYEFNFSRGSSSYQETQAFDAATGNSLNTQTITLALNRREQEKKDVIVTLGGFQELWIICKDNNGKYFLFGETLGCILTNNDGGSGLAKTDPNRYTLTLVGEEPALATEVVDETAFTVG